MFKKYLSLVLVSIVTVVLLAGCKKEDQSTYNEIMDKGEMTFAMSGAYPPFNYIDDNGDLVGFDIDIANAIAEELGLKTNPITADFDGIIAGLNGNRYDMIIGSMSITEERLKEVNFTNPYYYDGAQFFAKTGSGLTSIEDLEDGVVGVVTGTTFHDALKEMDNVKDILQFSSDVDNFMAIEQGRADGLVTGKFVGIQAPEKYGVDIEPIGELLYAEDIAIAIRKEDTELLENVNEALQAIIENGKYEEISNKWFGQNIIKK
jgi:polar amino acid transport system substrate-binding protein